MTQSNGETQVGTEQQQQQTETAVVKQPNWDEMFGGLADKLGGKLDTLTQTVTTGLTPREQEEPEPDVEAMTNVDLTNYILRKMGDFMKSSLTESLKPVNEQINGLRTDYTVTSAKTEIAELRAQYKDFGDWQTEMVDLAKENPGLANAGIRRLYLLARAEAPDKASQLDRKYNPSPERPKLPFSMTPGEGGRPGSSNGTTVLTREEAGKAAFEEVAARHPVLAALQGMH